MTSSPTAGRDGRRQEILFALLHGSFTRGEPFRDIDVVVWLDALRLSRHERFRFALNLSVELRLALGYPVDVQVLIRRNEHDIAVDPITLGELRLGILRLPRGKKRSRLEGWFDAGVRRLQCLPWEADTGLRWAELLAALRTSGRAMPIKDSLVAATALAHDPVVVTRNRTDFEKTGVGILDPFSG